jgi:predicted Zn-dependent peptidase
MFLTDEPWDLDLLDSAKGSQIYSWAEREETIEDLSSASIKSYLRQNTDPYYNRRFVKRLAKVTLGDVQRLAQKYLPLYDDPNLTRTSVVCGSSDVQGVVENFKQYNIDLTVIEDVSNSILTD